MTNLKSKFFTLSPIQAFRYRFCVLFTHCVCRFDAIFKACAMPTGKSWLPRCLLERWKTLPGLAYPPWTRATALSKVSHNVPHVRHALTALNLNQFTSWTAKKIQKVPRSKPWLFRFLREADSFQVMQNELVSWLQADKRHLTPEIFPTSVRQENARVRDS